MRINNTKGVTLVELMIVVAIIAVLAGIATVAYGNYIRQGKIQRLQAIAFEIKSGQERYRSRNNRYFPATPGTVAYDTANKAKYEKLLDFTTPVPADVEIEVESWVPPSTCTICEGVPPAAGKMGFAVVVKQNMKNPSDTVLTTLVFHNDVESPIILNEGE